MKRWFALLAALLMLAPAAAQAQIAPVQVQFVGTINGSAADTLVLRGPNNTTVPWTGPLPDFPYMKGDQITLSMNVLPGTNVLDPNNPAKPTDGIYRFSVVGHSQLSGVTSPLSTALIQNKDVSGPIAGSGLYEASNGLMLVYNANTGAYSIEMPTGNYVLGEWGSPNYKYDAATNSMALTPIQPGGCDGYFNTCVPLTGTMDSGAFNRIPVQGNDGGFVGFFSLLFSGDWFINGVKQGGGGATDVPEPGQLGMMALALLPLVARRRRRFLRA